MSHSERIQEAARDLRIWWDEYQDYTILEGGALDDLQDAIKKVLSATHQPNEIISISPKSDELGAISKHIPEQNELREALQTRDAEIAELYRIQNWLRGNLCETHFNICTMSSGPCGMCRAIELEIALSTLMERCVGECAHEREAHAIEWDADF